MLYFYVIQKRASPSDFYNEYLAAAIQCQSHISSIADQGSLPERYLLLLEELRLEAIRQTSRNRNIGPTSGTAPPPMGSQESLPPSDLQPNQCGTVEVPSMEPAIDFNAVFPDQMSDYADWDMFASMVSSGLGNLDAFLVDEPLGQVSEFAPTQPGAS